MSEEMKVIEDMQQVMEQMRLDDIEDNPNSETELFACSCCGLDKPTAGSIMYSMDIIFCNDCALLSEVAFAMNKIADISDFLKLMEDKKLENLCDYVRIEQSRLNN
ncbi:MAG: hypothetical protein WCF95_01935 [bacterium]